MVTPLVVYFQEVLDQMGVCDLAECTSAGVALEEALVNALHHGNLEVPSELRGRGDDLYFDLLTRRCRELPYANRKVHVEADVTRQRGVFTVRDEGAGFDRNSVPNPLDPDGLERVSGRGLLLMRTFMDEVVFNEAGNAVTMTKRRRDAGVAGAEPGRVGP
jgi:anti-sigma regulatory factor (Ser/Thr protein kinase)